MNNILVTGGDGQLGSELKALAQYLKNDNFFFTNSKELNITNYDSILSLVNLNSINVIINCAAYTNVENAEIEFDLADNVNNIAVKYISQIAKKNKIKLIHISTDFVFDGLSKKRFYDEEDATNPINIYGKTKLLGEKQIFSVSPKRAIIIRTSWLYSRFGNNFPKKIIKFSKKNPKLQIVDDNIGSPTNAFELAKTILKIIPNINNDKPEIYHFSNLGECSWFEFAQEILKKNNLKNKIIPVSYKHYNQKALRPSRCVLNKDKIINKFSLEILDWKDSFNNKINI